MLPDDEVDIYSGVDSEAGDVLDYAGGAVDVDDSFVDSHFESVPGLGSLSARGLSCCNSQNLSWDSHGASSLIALVPGSGHDLRTSVF